MEMTMRLPANYNLMTEEEMTYTEGGAGEVYGLVSLGFSVALSALSIYNYVWGINQGRNWIKANKSDDLGVMFNKAVDDLAADMSKSLWNTVRDCYTAINLVSLWPITLVAFVTA